MIQSDFPTRQPAPKIGENGTWLEWDEQTQAYVDTGVTAASVIDATLSVSGEAADAKATGDRLRTLDELADEVTEALDWNLIRWGFTAKTIQGATFTVNDDGTLTVNGTVTTANVHNGIKLLDAADIDHTAAYIVERTVVSEDAPVSGDTATLWTWFGYGATASGEVTTLRRGSPTVIPEGMSLFLLVSKRASFHNQKLQVQVYKGTELRPYAPPESVTALDLEARRLTEELGMELQQSAPVRNATMSMFARFGVCGASWDSGYYYTSASAHAEREDVSWGANLARRNGNTFCNYSKESMTTRSYLTDSNCLSKLLADDPCDLYVITLGGNDSSSLGAAYLGTLADITGYTSFADYPDTYYGNYGKIIEQIQAHAPNAKIVLIMRCGPAASAVRQSFNAAKDEIAEHYGLPHLNWMDDDWCGSDFFLSMEEHDHPTPASLSGMADAWERLFSRCVNENQSYFKYYDGSVPSSGGGGGGSVTVDGALSATSVNPVQNKVIKAALDGKGTYSKPSGGIPKTDLDAAVQTSLGKADTALQQHQDISGKLNISQGTANAGKFVVVGSDGNLALVTMTAWQGGSY